MSCAPKLCQSGTPTMVPGSQDSCLFVWCPLLSSAGAESETAEEEGDGGAKWLEPPKSVKELPRAKLLEFRTQNPNTCSQSGQFPKLWVSLLENYKIGGKHWAESFTVS